MPVSFERISIGENYTRPQLASLWGYRGFEAISRGAITPRNTPYIILFITRDKQDFQTQYQNEFRNEELRIEGETNHAADERIIQADATSDEIHLFYRDRHHSPFEYKGRVYLSWCDRNTGRPSRFRFYTQSSEQLARIDIETEQTTNGNAEAFIPDEEGRRVMRQHVSYERSPRNRAEALRIHGRRCLACSFDFDAFFGATYANHFIQVHHNRSITEQEGRPVNPATDLTPLCSNCHSMAHRQRGRILTLEELRGLISAQAGQRIAG